ncbi:MAG: hypothetical protein NZL87_05565, partial [Thermomicrobium sp.]|nr:hypothetical protein [Thermomicrobium sp.]
VLQARYLQDGGTSVADAPSRALLAIVERTLFAWSARASRAHSSLEMSDPASVAAALEEAAHAARSGLAALMQL